MDMNSNETYIGQIDLLSLVDSKLITVGNQAGIFIPIGSNPSIYRRVTKKGQAYNEDWWEGPTTDNDKLIIKNNVIANCSTYGIRVEQLHAKSSSLGVAYVEITDNTMTSTTAALGLDIVGGSAGWKVVSTGNTFNGASDAQNGTKEG